jgi:hypothetical protein
VNGAKLWLRSVQNADQIHYRIAAGELLLEHLRIERIGFDQFDSRDHEQLAVAFPVPGEHLNLPLFVGKAGHQVATHEAAAPQNANYFMFHGIGPL